MDDKNPNLFKNSDSTGEMRPSGLGEDQNVVESRKNGHIDLALKAQTTVGDFGHDSRFDYNPLESSTSSNWADRKSVGRFLGKILQTPLWVSSMTGGSERAKELNTVMARACAKFGVPMGLGSCRSLLDSESFVNRIDDFRVRTELGPDNLLFMNLGLAQIAELLSGQYSWDRLEIVYEELQADGLIVHVNPLQELLQPEGHWPDSLTASGSTGIEILRSFSEKFSKPIIVKEVGQGFGPDDLKELCRMNLAAIELAAFGGTNFSLIEQLRNSENSIRAEVLGPFIKVGETLESMLEKLNQIDKAPVLILSGGIRSVLDAHYFRLRCKHPCLVGQASGVLKYALQGQAALDEYIGSFVEGLEMAERFLSLKEVEKGR